MTEVGKHFELVFEGPVDDSAETSRRLRTTLLADLGMSVAEALDVLKNSPRTLKTADTEEDLKPIYSALKKAGGKVLIVRPTVTKNDDAYFLDIESEGLTDDLIASLESSETVPEVESVADNSKTYTLEVDSEPVSPIAASDPIIPAQVLPSTPSVTDMLLTLENEKEEKVESTPTPEAKPATAVINDDKPLFEFAAATPTPTAAPTAPPASASSDSAFDLSIELEDSPAPSAPTKTKEHASQEREPTDGSDEPDPFSSQALSLSLNESAPPISPPRAKAAPSAPEPTMALETEPETKPIPRSSPPAAPKHPAPIAEPVPPASEKLQRPAAPAPESVPTQVSLSNTRTKTKKPSSSMPIDIIGPITVGAIILGVANWMYFHDSSPKFGEIDEKLLEASNESQVKKPAASAERQSTIALPQVKGNVSTEEYSLAWNMELDGEKPRSFNFELSTAPPKPLSPEEIVNNVAPRPWLEKLEADQVPLENEGPNIYRAQTQARAFIAQGQRKRRVPASFSLHLEKIEGSNNWNAHVRIWRGFNELEEIPAFQFEMLPNQDIRLSLRGDFFGTLESK